MTTADMIAALATVSIPTHFSASSNLADALAWSLNIVRAARRADWRARDYAVTWIRHNAHALQAVVGGFADRLILATSAMHSTAGDAALSSEELEQLDVALCDTIERVDRARGCGWYGKDGRLNHRPAPFERAAA